MLLRLFMTEAERKKKRKRGRKRKEKGKRFECVRMMMPVNYHRIRKEGRKEKKKQDGKTARP